ncbi:MAG: hypothetical protein H6578_06515 [Chitinophagales bacterium]|nr:hypothetical protein [Chitinophagales bacterium]
MKSRTYHYFFAKDEHKSDKYLKIEGKDDLYYKTIEFECLDRFDGELAMFAFPIAYLHHADKIFNLFGLQGNIDDFFEECRDVIAVPEKHQDEKGNVGKMNFQAYFHDVPNSLESINDKAIVVVALDVMQDDVDAQGRKAYKLAGYIHANQFQFTDGVNGTERHNSYYYNMLRISEAEKNGKKLYRRTGVFSTVFGILLDLVNQNDVHFVYATMGKENKSINNSLIKLAEFYDKKWDILSMTSNSHLSLLYGREKYRKQLIDITHDKARIEELYYKSKEHRGNYMFNQYPTFEEFYHQYRRVIDYSKSTGAYMLTDKEGNMKAACVAVNWGDYFAFLFDNPKGIFKLLAKLKITEQLLYFWQTIGEPAWVEKMYRGIAQKYLKEHKVKMGLYNYYDGDPYTDIKKSIINDPFNYFVIYDRPELYQKLKETSKDKDGNVRIFIDTPVF